jgi:hypothetical protein
MSWLNPFGLLALVVLPIIFTLYFLRPERKRATVSTIALWREALREPRMGAGLRRLIHGLSLVLLLLAGAAAALGLGDPRWFTTATAPSDVILVIDTSASMSAPHAEGTRLDAALKAAKTRLDALPVGGRALIMTAGIRPRLESTLDGDRIALNQALAGIVTTDEVGVPETALSLATSLLPQREQGQVVFFTDGAFGAQRLSRAAGVEVVFVTDGDDALAGGNVAITGFDVRAEIGVVSGYQVLVTIANLSDQQRTVPVTVGSIDITLAARDVVLEPNAFETFVLPLEGVPPSALFARIDVDDALAADNTSVVVPRQEREIRVALYSPGSFYLDSVLAALPNVVVYRRDAEAAEQFGQRGDAVVGVVDRGYDIAVFDRLTPRALPPGRYLLIDALPAGLPVSRGAVVTQPVLTYFGASTLLSGIDFSNLRIDVAHDIVRMPTAAKIQRLLGTERSDLAIAMDDGARRAVYLSFDPAASNFPLMSAFPLFVSQSLDWLAEIRSRAVSRDTRAGVGRVLALSADASEVEVRRPDGTVDVLPPAAGTVRYNRTRRAGLYRYTAGGVGGRFAVNLSDLEESDVRPRAQVDAVPGSANVGRQGEIETTLWPLLVSLALAFLVVEWLLGMTRGARA